MRVRKLAWVSVVILVGVMVWWVVGRPTEVTTARPAGGLVAPPGAGSAPLAATPPSILAPSQHLRRISEDQRREIQALIAEAHSRRARGGSDSAASADRGSDGPGRRIAVEQVAVPVKSTLEEAIPILADCYVRTGKKQPRAAVVMTLIGDPSVGTLVDPTQMFDDEHKPLDPALDQCLRETFATLELPPLDGGDKLDIQYSFRFDD